MATEYPPLGKSYVAGFTADNKSYPVIVILRDPRDAGYQTPNDLSPHPDKVRYPNHVFTGAKPGDSDTRVRWVYEILPGPWVPFTRYDDDLGPIQGRRRAVANSGQQASLTQATKISYEGREGSAIVLLEIEETWDIGVDEDGNSLFPVKERDFYDPLKGAVRERKQLVLPSDENVATLDNVNGIITQVEYEAYNQFLQYRVTTTYAAPGPELVGVSTDQDGVKSTVTIRRKPSDGYAAPDNTALLTVQAERQDIESLVETQTEKAEVFPAEQVSVRKPEIIPQRFIADRLTTSRSETKIGEAPEPTLDGDEIQNSVQQLTKFTYREDTVERDENDISDLYGRNYDEVFNIQIPYTEQILDTIPVGPADVDPIGDGRYLVRLYDPEAIRSVLEGFLLSYPARVNINLPRVLKSIDLEWAESVNEGVVDNENEATGEFGSLSQQDSGNANASLSLSPEFALTWEDVNGSGIFAETKVFFLEGPVTTSDILTKADALQWPVFKTQGATKVFKSLKVSKQLGGAISRSIGFSPNDNIGTALSKSKQTSQDTSINPIILNIPPCIHGGFSISESPTIAPTQNLQINLNYQSATAVSKNGQVITFGGITTGYTDSLSLQNSVVLDLPATTPSDIPRSLKYMIDSDVTPYKFGWFLVKATIIDAAQFA
jgi:hypothetical protein